MGGMSLQYLSPCLLRSLNVELKTTAPNLPSGREEVVGAVMGAVVGTAPREVRFLDPRAQKGDPL
jgi:hypothetical protein